MRLHPRQRIAWLQAAAAAARQVGDRGGEGTALGNLGSAHADLGETRRAIEFYEHVLTITREIGDRRGEGNALGGLGVAYKDIGETRRAIEFYEQQLIITREIGDRHGEGNALGNLGFAYAHLGLLDKSLDAYDRALALAKDPTEILEGKHSRGVCLIGMGRLEEGFKDYETRNSPRFRAYVHHMIKAPVWMPIGQGMEHMPSPAHVSIPSY